MESLFTDLLTILLNGGPHAIISILVLVIIIMYIDRRRLIADLNKKDAKIDQIIDDYYKGNLTLSDALNSLKVVLYEIKARL